MVPERLIPLPRRVSAGTPRMPCPAVRTMAACVVRGALLACFLAAPLAASDIAAESVDGTLRGTLAQPDEDVLAAALILPGSGPVDRDGNNGQGLRTDAYRLLAEGLAGRGIATARIDKRGVGASAGAGAGIDLAGYRADTEAWIAAIRAATGQSCLWLVGHSEGAYLALDGAGLDGVCGLVLVAAPGTSLRATLRRQIAEQPALESLLPAFDAAARDLAAGRVPAMQDLPVALRPIFVPENVSYLRDLFWFDPVERIAATRGPVLILHGDADIQIPAADGAALAAARPDAVRVVLAGMTHMLKRLPSEAGDGEEAALRANLATYRDPRLPLHPGVVPAISGFILDGDE